MYVCQSPSVLLGRCKELSEMVVEPPAVGGTGGREKHKAATNPFCPGFELSLMMQYVRSRKVSTLVSVCGRKAGRDKRKAVTKRRSREE